MKGGEKDKDKDKWERGKGEIETERGNEVNEAKQMTGE